MCLGSENGRNRNRQIQRHEYITEFTLTSFRLIKVYLSHLMAKTNLMTCAPSEDSDQRGHPPSLISLRCPHEETLGPQLPNERLRRLWSDWADAQAGLSLRWAHRSFCWFWHEVAHIIMKKKKKKRHQTGKLL